MFTTTGENHPICSGFTLMSPFPSWKVSWMKLTMNSTAETHGGWMVLSIDVCRPSHSGVCGLAGWSSWTTTTWEPWAKFWYSFGFKVSLSSPPLVELLNKIQFIKPNLLDGSSICRINCSYFIKSQSEVTTRFVKGCVGNLRSLLSNHQFKKSLSYVLGLENLLWVRSIMSWNCFFPIKNCSFLYKLTKISFTWLKSCRC